MPKFAIGDIITKSNDYYLITNVKMSYSDWYYSHTNLRTGRHVPHMRTDHIDAYFRLAA